MAFWKKSEDPWDMDPADKRRSVPAEEESGPGLLDQLQDWNEARKAEKARKLAESTPAPIACPWCGNLMEARFLWGGKGVYLGKQRPGFFSSGLSEDNWDILDEGSLISGSYKTVWYCPDCRKLAADIPAPSPEQMERLARTMDTRAAEEYLKTREEEN